MTTNAAPGAGATSATTIGAEFEGANFEGPAAKRAAGEAGRGFRESAEREHPRGHAPPCGRGCRVQVPVERGRDAGCLVAPHIAQVVERAAAAKVIVVPHDTTEFEFGGSSKRAGMGRLGGSKRQGFFGHVSLAITADATRRPLGVLGLHTWARTSPRRSSKKRNGKRRSGPEYAKLKTKESQRWLKQVRSVELQVGSRAEVIHLMDREGDAFPLLAGMVTTRAASWFASLVTALHARIKDQDRIKVRALVAQAEDVLTLEVPVAARKAKGAPRANERPAHGSRASHAWACVRPRPSSADRPT